MKLETKLEQASRTMSYALRHKPEKLNLTLDANGYTDVTTLCKELKITEEDLQLIVSSNNKQRFAYNDDKTKLRASQGHSIAVELD